MLSNAFPHAISLERLKSDESLFKVSFSANKIDMSTITSHELPEDVKLDTEKTFVEACNTIEEIKRMIDEDVRNNGKKNLKAHSAEISKLLDLLKKAQLPLDK